MSPGDMLTMTGGLVSPTERTTSGTLLNSTLVSFIHFGGLGAQESYTRLGKKLKNRQEQQYWELSLPWSSDTGR